MSFVLLNISLGLWKLILLMLRQCGFVDTGHVCCTCTQWWPWAVGELLNALRGQEKSMVSSQTIKTCNIVVYGGNIVINMSLSPLFWVCCRQTLNLYFCQINAFDSLGLNSELTKTVQCSCCRLGLFITGHKTITNVKVQHCEMSSVKLHGVCLFFHSRSGSRLSGSGSALCTSGEESSVEWSSAQLDTDEQPCSEDWLVGSKATQLRPQMPQTNF